MDQIIATALGLLGIAMGLFSSYGLLGKYEAGYWLVLACVAAFVITRYVKKNHFRLGWQAGFDMGLLKAAMQMALFDTYIQHNPQYAASFHSIAKAIAPTIAPAAMMIIATAVLGAVFGLLVGLLSWLGTRAERRPPAL
jgi:hypothetical protein